MEETQESLSHPLGKEDEAVIKLSTDIELASRGMHKFETLTRQLPLQVKGIFLRESDIWTCFIGTTPEIGGVAGTPLDKLPAELLDRIESLMEMYSPDIILIHHQPKTGETSTKISMVNAEAVKQVALNYPEYFPQEVTIDPKRWLQSNISEWMTGGGSDLAVIRHGLLSGYPLESIMNFPRYWDTRHKIQHEAAGVFSQEEVDFFMDYTLGEIPFTEQNMDRMQGIITKAADKVKLSDQEKGLLVRGRTMISKALGSFLGFNTPEENAYLEEVETIYEQSGIETVIERLGGKGGGVSSVKGAIKNRFSSWFNRNS